MSCKVKKSAYTFFFFFFSCFFFFLMIMIMSDPSFVGAPVTAFHHAPMSDGWDNIIVGMKVENYVI